MSCYINEPARQLPVVLETDLCVVGGSCTGVFAAVRAARLGLRVALIENQSMLGGMAVTAQVNEWHSVFDTQFQTQIIGGLTMELIQRLKKRGAVHEVSPLNRGQFRFNSAEMAVELDRLVQENKIRVFLNARCVAAATEGRAVKAAVIEDKNGRRAVKSSFFIDASGDGDLLRQAGFEAYKNEVLQPVNLQAITSGYDDLPAGSTRAALDNFAEEFNYPRANSTPWPFEVPGVPQLRNIFGPRLNGVDASDADQLTTALFESRRLHLALCEMTEKQTGCHLSLVNFSPALGVRETWHARCLHQLQSEELLRGHDFSDTVARGTYPTDVHSESGTILRYLDGREEFVARDGSVTWRRWRDETESTPLCYNIPYRCLVPQSASNLLVAGRLIDAAPEAFGGVRVMVNCNQMGEATGVAAYVALQKALPANQVPADDLRETLIEGGSLLQ